jgi:hypothetical protein
LDLWKQLWNEGDLQRFGSLRLGGNKLIFIYKLSLILRFMKKKKQKAKRIYRRLAFWLGVLVLGTIVGVSVQFTRAWVEPSSTAPDSNIAAPINTGASIQTKVGTMSQKADICVDPNGTGDKKCLGDLITFPNCTLSGGIPITVGALTICKFAGSSCPKNVKTSEATTINWTQYLNYSEATANTCTGTGSCATSVTSGSHSFGNVDLATEALEAKSYYSGEKPWIIVSCPNNTCIPCWIAWERPPHMGCSGYYCSAADEVWGWGSCSTTPSTCKSTKVAVGCIIE